MSAPIRFHTAPEHPAVFIADDGENEPSLWARGADGDPPRCIGRRCEYHPLAWSLLSSGIAALHNAEHRADVLNQLHTRTTTAGVAEVPTVAHVVTRAVSENA